MLTDIKVAVWRYDRTQALYDGRVKLAGRALSMIDAPIETMFTKAFTSADYEVTELSFSNYLRHLVDGECAYRGIPIFPSRAFRHGAFYVRADSDIAEPAGLIGKKIGVREFSMTAALVARGALRDQFGIEADQMHWIMGDVNEKERDAIMLPNLTSDVRIEVAPDGAFLDDMLLNGELDAILAYKPMNSALGEAPRSRRLFAKPDEVEETYYRQTGVFPIMHLIGLRQQDNTADPGLARAVFDAFLAAQMHANDALTYEQALKIGLPWLRREVERTRSLMGPDFWSQGFTQNRAVLETMIDWSFKDGLISRRVAPEDLFLDTLLDT